MFYLAIKWSRKLRPAVMPFSHVRNLSRVPGAFSESILAGLRVLAETFAVGQDVTFSARSKNGIDLCNDTQSFGAGEHVAFVIHDRLPCTAGIDGVLEVQGSSIGLAGFGITAQDDGAFVTQPVYGEVPD